LPEPALSPEAGEGRATRGRGARTRPSTRPEPEPEPAAPEPPPEPEVPPRPAIRITHARWRGRRDDRDEIVAVVRRLDDAWLAGDATSMADDLHPSVILVPPEPGKRIEGREAAVDRYRELPSDAVTVAWTETDLTVDVVGASAVLRYRYELEW